MEEYNNISYTIRTDENDPTGANSEKVYKSNYEEIDSISKISSQNDQSLINFHYLCKQCNSFPSISINYNHEKIIFKCDNNKHKGEIELDTFIKEIKSDNIDINKYQLCQEHNKKITKVCIECKQNLCEECKHEDKHQIRRYEDLKEENKYLINFLNNYAEELKQEEIPKNTNGSVSNSKNKNFNEVLKSKDEKEKYNSKELSQNFHEKSKEIIYLRKLIKIILGDLENIPNYIHFENLKKFNYLFDNKLILKYNIKNNDSKKIRLLGEEFVKNNKNNCSLIINGEIKELREEYELTNINTILRITLLKTNYITDMSYMFDNCVDLLSISDDSKWITNEVKNMRNMFNNCESLESLPKNISEWDTSKVKDMSYMFKGCKSLQYLPDICNWNTKEVNDMCFIFADCLALEKLKNIFKWETTKVKDMSYMFCNCQSLRMFDDYDGKSEKWDTSNVTNISNMFYGCESLKRVPENISQWKVEKVQYMSCMFYNCKCLESLPDGIENWNTKNLLRINYMFTNCSSLIKLPDITKWDISNLEDIYEMIDGCDSLKDEGLPNFYKWNNSNKKNKIIYKGEKLEKLIRSFKKNEDKDKNEIDKN